MTALLFLKYIGWQLLAAFVLVIVGFGIDGRSGALATVIGSGIAIFPNAYFALQAFRHKASEDPVRALSALYRGETGKIILVMVFSALAFRFIELSNPLLLFTALFIMLVTQTIASVCIFPMLRRGGDSATERKNDEID